MTPTDTKPKNIWPFFVLGLVLIGLFLVGTKLLLSVPGPVPSEDAARSEERRKAYEELQAENQAMLGTYAWADKAKGTVQIPIEAAMKLTAARLAGEQPRPAGPVNAAAPSLDAAAAGDSAPTDPAPPVQPTTEPAPAAPDTGGSP